MHPLPLPLPSLPALPASSSSSSSQSPPPAIPANPSASAPSLFNRISSRFAISVSSSSSSKLKHHRSVVDFYIQPENPYRTYSAGDRVTGHVHLSLSKPLRISHIVLCLHGFIRVSKNSLNPNDLGSSPGTPASAPRSSNRNDSSNSSASLIQEEITLCGEGRLKEGSYKLDFELRFPEHNLPSSINFEKGAISYMLVSTLTRPTAISPVLTCEKRLVYAEPIDIASLPLPKPRVISLESLSKRHRPTRSGKKYSSSVSEASNISTAVSTAGTDIDSQQHAGERGGHQSPAPSEDSSAVSNYTQSLRLSNEEQHHQHNQLQQQQQQQQQQQRDIDENTATDDASSLAPSLPAPPDDDKIIVATVEVLKAGVLPGDILPVRILIKHTKPVRISNGVIITLYRQGRVDCAPSTDGKGGGSGSGSSWSAKSKSSLSLLTFGSTRTRSTYRKDLAQTFAPLMVDPTTMKASIKTSLRIPEDLFPTISRVPGGMISFRYYIEIVLDIRGKLDRYLPKAIPSSYNNFSACPQTTTHGFQSDAGSNANPVWGLAGNILDTTDARREKSVVSSVFEVVIGTRDSGRSAIAQGGQASIDDDRSISTLSTHDNMNTVSLSSRGSQPQFTPLASSLPLSSPPPPPLPQPEEEIDEKTRLRMAEQLLLPSQPPLVGDGAMGSDVPHMPMPMPLPLPIPEDSPIAHASAPMLPEDEDEDEEQSLAYLTTSSHREPPPAFGPPPTLPLHNHNNDRNIHSASNPTTTTTNPYYRYLPTNTSNNSMPPSSPSLFGYTHLDSHHPVVANTIAAAKAETEEQGEGGGGGEGEDKQELERQRLFAAASAPPGSSCSQTGTAPGDVGDDKQELERRRLLAAASSPVGIGDDEGNGDGGLPPPPVSSIPVRLPVREARSDMMTRPQQSQSQPQPPQPHPESTFTAPSMVEHEPGHHHHHHHNNTNNDRMVLLNSLSSEDSLPRYQL